LLQYNASMKERESAITAASMLRCKRNPCYCKEYKKQLIFL